MIRELRKADINKVANIWLDTNITAHYFIPAQYWQNNRNSHHPNISPVISGYKRPSKSAQSIEITGFIEKSKPSQIIFLYTLLPLTA